MIFIRSFSRTILPSKLHEEILMLFPLKFLGIVSSNSINFEVQFSSDLTALEDTQLVSAVNAHVPSRLGYRIWDLVEDPKASYITPYAVNFSLLPLVKKEEYIKGEIQKIYYYDAATCSVDQVTGVITYGILILQTSWTYTRDPIGFLVKAEEKIEWFLEDGSICSKTRIKPHFYDGLNKIREGVKRRTNIVESIQIPISEMLITNATVAKGSSLTTIETEAQIQRGRDLLTAFSIEFSAFKKHSDKLIISAIQNDALHGLLNETVYGSNPSITIRDYVISEMSI